MQCKDLVDLSEKTGWNLLNPNNNKLFTWCPQIVFGNRNDDKTLCCLWWSDFDKVFKLCCKVNGRYIFNDRKMKFKKIGTYVKWCKKAEQKMKERMEKNKLAKIAKDFV